ncbi:MAG: twin-arginine translocase TatA/TatE family subunit [bacterium]|nr:twin-arginine translocase TatA/TatE family subunit [bacterium]
MFGSTEIIVVVLIVFVLFGASAIPRFAKSLGQAKKEFESGLSDSEKTQKNDTKETKES